MKTSYKALFIPVSDVLLSGYKGFVDENKPVQNISQAELTAYKVECGKDFSPFWRHAGYYLLSVPFIAAYPFMLSADLFSRGHKVKKRYLAMWHKWPHEFFKDKAVCNDFCANPSRKKRTEGLRPEDVPVIFDTCRKYFVKIIFYRIGKITHEQRQRAEILQNEGWIKGCFEFERLSDLQSVIKNESISVFNSVMVIDDVSLRYEAEKLGFWSGYNPNLRNVILLSKRYSHGLDELEWNTIENYRGLYRRFEYYLNSKSSAFFDNRTVFYFEENYNELLNDYIQKHYDEINRKMAARGFRLFYYPALRKNPEKLTDAVIDFLLYRRPDMNILSKAELIEMCRRFLEKTPPGKFYNMIQEELELTYFDKPCLLRRFDHDEMDFPFRFTHGFLNFEKVSDIEQYFDFYTGQLTDAKTAEPVFYCLAPSPKDYDADWYFNKESKVETEALFRKIDQLKAAGEYGVLAEAIVYMLKHIREERPEWLEKLKPVIERNNLLNHEIPLSRLVVDKQFRILFPDYGNLEVKMHALPKTLYLLFLRHPEGIRFKELYQHRDELLRIYKYINRTSDHEKVIQSIDDLTDMTNPSINQKSARIREAFRDIMDENTARHYYLQGYNGKPKKISLPPEMIDLQFELMD